MENTETQIFPSEEFAKKTGMKWTMEEWKLPRNITADETYNKIDKLYAKLDSKRGEAEARIKIVELFNEFIQLNPESSPAFRTKRFWRSF